MSDKPLQKLPIEQNRSIDLSKCPNLIVNKDHARMEKKLSFLIALSISIFIIVLFFITYKLIVNIYVENIDMTLCPSIEGNDDQNGYDLNFLNEQLYYKSLSATEKANYLKLTPADKSSSINKFLTKQVLS